MGEAFPALQPLAAHHVLVEFVRAAEAGVLGDAFHGDLLRRLVGQALLALGGREAVDAGGDPGFGVIEGVFQRVEEVPA